MHILMIFLDGVGLGDDDPNTNPFSLANTPTLKALTNGKGWFRSTGRQTTDRAVFIPTDPRLGVEGRPQSATGQATIVTGRNVPQLIGEHYGPKPNEPIRDLLAEDNFFKQVVAHGKRAAMLEAYPPRWHTGVNSGKRLRASYQQAVHEAGLPILTVDDYLNGDALVADWTGEAFRDEFGYTEAPIYTPKQAGEKLVELSRRYDFTFFPHWFTDVVGHRGPMERAVALLERIDRVLAGVLETWSDDEGLVLLTSDHGNIERIGDRRHTENDVPTLVIGDGKEAFADGLAALTDFVPRMSKLLLT